MTDYDLWINHFPKEARMNRLTKLLCTASVIDGKVLKDRSLQGFQTAIEGEMNK